MNCQEVMELMQRQLDGDLNSHEEDELHAHLAQCADCVQMFERLQRLSDELTQLPKVVPPYSLVDAILPQLAEIDRGAAASITDKAAVVTPDVRQNERGQSTKLPWTRRFSSQFSWKFAGGVVAAGLILGFFVFNMKQPLLDNADGLLPMSRQAEESSAASSQQKRNVQEEDPKKNEVPAANSAVPAAPAADASGEGANGLEKQEPQNFASGGNGPQATTEANLEKPDAIDTSKSEGAKDPSQVDPSTSAPERMKDIPSGGETKKTEPAPTAPVSAGETAANKGADNQTASPSPTPAGTPEPAPMAKKGAESDLRGGIFSLTAPASENVLTSASGTLTAAVEDQHVVIRNSATGDLVFASKKAWQPEDQITLVEWSKDDKLFYQVLSGGSLHMVRIDVNLKTEETP